MRRKKPPKEQEEEQKMYPPYSPWGPPPGYGYGYPPPPTTPPIQYIAVPAQPKNRRERRDFFQKLEEKLWGDLEDKIRKAEDKPKARTFSRLEMVGIVTIGSLFVYPIEVLIIKTVATLLATLPH